MHPLLAAKLGIKDGDIVKVVTRRGEIDVAGAGREDDSAGHGVRSVSLAGQEIRKSADEPRADPISKIPEYKVCALPGREGGRL